MKEYTTKWQVVPDINSPFGSISYSFKNDSLLIRMIGEKTLALNFSGVIALRFEQECPGIDFPPPPHPMLRESETFPLLIVEGSQWLERFNAIYNDRLHFALISFNHLAQVIALPNVEARWE